MEKKVALLLTISLPLILVGYASADLEVKATPNTGLDPKVPLTGNNNTHLDENTGGGLKSSSDSGKVDQVKKEKDPVGKAKEDVKNDNKSNEGNSSEEKQVGLREDKVGKKEKDGTVGEGDKKETLSEGSESKEAMTNEVPVSLPPVRKEGSRGEECDESNSCKDVKNALVACLRVPGNDSPDLSLLIQNKGNGPLNVTISAPDFVQLEKSKIQVPEKANKKVKVSIGKSGTDTLIVLTAANGNCSLDFRDLSSPNLREETDYRRKSTYNSLVKQPLFIAFIVFAALLLTTASAWMCVSFKKRHFNSNDSKYQKLDMELPVSGEGKLETNLNDRWDNNWDDNWDDEEAPKTPSMPVTPSLSSKGLASRRLNKDGWKD